MSKKSGLSRPRKKCPKLCGLHAGTLGGTQLVKEKKKIAAVFETGELEK
jgi:hypothetical protein